MLDEFLEILEKYLISLLAKMKHCVIPATKYFFHKYNVIDGQMW